MSGVLVLLVLIVVAAIVVLRAVHLVRRRAVLPGRLLPPPCSPSSVEAAALLAALRRRGGAAVIAVAAVVLLCLAVQAVWPSGGGLPIVLAPALALLVLTGTHAVWPLPDEPAPSASTRTHADITTRRAGGFGPSWGYSLPALLMAATLASVIVAGLVATPDEAGRSREYGYAIAASALPGEVGPASGTTGPFPGWYYGIPVIVVLLVSALLLGWALHRNARRPRLRGAGLVAFDDAVRTCVDFALSAGAGTLLALQLALLGLMAGPALLNAARNIPGAAVSEGGGMAGADVPTLWAGVAVLVLALVLLGVVAVLGATFMSWILGQRRPPAGQPGRLQPGGAQR